MAVGTPQGERVMRAVDEGRGKVVVVSTAHDAGKKLNSLGGLAAFLRYRFASPA